MTCGTYQGISGSNVMVGRTGSVITVGTGSDGVGRGRVGRGGTGIGGTFTGGSFTGGILIGGILMGGTVTLITGPGTVTVRVGVGGAT